MFRAVVGKSTRFGRAGVTVITLITLAGCSSVPKVTPRPVARAHASAPSPVIGYALSLQGSPYRWGGTSPVRGFDCSGFVRHVFGRYGIGLPRTAQDMAQFVPKIPMRGRRPGDLLFFYTGGRPVSHVGIYLGREDFIHASSGRARVMISNLRQPYWWQRLVAIGRAPMASRANVRQ